MRIQKFLGSAAVVGSAGLLILGNLVAQVPPQSPAAQDVEKKSPAETEIRVDEQVQSNAKSRIEAVEGNKSNPDAKAEAEAQTKGKARSRNARASREGKNSRSAVTEKAPKKSERNLGFEFQDDQDESLTISSIRDNSLAARTGLQAGDRIVSIDGREFSSNDKLNAYLSGHIRGQVDVIFDRDGRRYRTSFLHPGRLTARDEVDNRHSQLMGAYFAEGRRGIVVNDLPESSPLIQAGFHSGDEIVCFNGWSYGSVDQFVSTMNRMPKNQPIAVNVIRDGQLMSTQVTLPMERSTYADGSVDIENRGQVRSSNQPPIPPAPEPADAEGDERGDRYARSQTQGRRTALKPNFEELSRGELQRKVDELQDENQKLKRELNKLRTNSATHDETKGQLDRSKVESRNLDENGEVEADTESKSETNIETRTETDSSQSSKKINQSDSKKNP